MWFLDFFSNIFNVLMVVIFTCIGILIGVLLLRYVVKPKNQVLYCRERDGRGLELDTEREDAISFQTKSDPKLRFFKYGRAYEFRKRGRSFTRFFGKEGTAYTWALQGFHKKPVDFDEKTETHYLIDPSTNKPATDKDGNLIAKDVPIKIPKTFKEEQISVEFPTLESAVKSKWGDEFYSNVPDKMKDLLRDDKLLVTVNLEPGIVPEGYEPITESTVLNVADEKAAELWATSLKGAFKKGVLDVLPWLLAGAGILAIASKLLGWWA